MLRLVMPEGATSCNISGKGLLRIRELVWKVCSTTSTYTIWQNLTKLDMQVTRVKKAILVLYYDLLEKDTVQSDTELTAT